ncbi:hypothetical protein ACFC06_14585 [Nocardia sp. NPDC056064]|uniref:hypothetical protein n=1 Tax=Nocardia sp. NPDC056064 TaxID=3345701 RepID=UPI0035DF0F66
MDLRQGRTFDRIAAVFLLVAAMMLWVVRAWAVLVETDYTFGRFTLYEIAAGLIVAVSVAASALALLGITSRVPALRGLTLAAAGIALGESLSSLAAWAETGSMLTGLSWLYFPMTFCALAATATAAIGIALEAGRTARS